VVHDVIALACGACLTWPAPVQTARSPQPDAAKPELAADLRRTFEDLAEAGFSGSVLVVRGDEVLLDAAAGLADRAHNVVNRSDTVFDVGSITKQFTATAILQLAQAKKLSIDDTLDHFFKPVPADKRAITVRHLLTHTSGLPTDVPVNSETSERDALVRACLTSKLQSQPGTVFAYNNIGYMLLAAIVELTAKTEYESYVTEHMFAPAGMTSSGFLHALKLDAARIAHGYEGRTGYGPADQAWYSWGLRGAGGVLSTTGDLMRWWRALQTDAILSKASRQQLFTPNLSNYACGWWVLQDEVLGRLIQHGGTTRGFEGDYSHFVERDLHVIVLCNDRDRSQAAASAFRLEIIKRPTPATAPFEAPTLANFAGNYEVPDGGVFAVRVEGEVLTLEPDAEAVIALEVRGGSKKLDSDAKLAARAKKIVELIDAGDAQGLQPLLNPHWIGWNKQLLRSWDEWREARGKFQKLEVLGSSGSSKTFVRLVHERRSVIWALRWSDDVFDGWTINAGLPEVLRFRPRSADLFTCRVDSAVGLGEYTLTFGRDSKGTVQRLVLSNGLLKVDATRAR
jgi:CubicO group peptidase (beta-lactamase class C family)